MSKYADDVVRISCTLDSFFRYWVEVLKPFHKLTNRECDILSEFLSKRHKLSKIISDEDVLDTMLMSDEIKTEIREKTNASPQSLHAVMTSFKKNKVLLEGKINKRFIPKISEEGDNYKLMFFFEVKR